MLAQRFGHVARDPNVTGVVILLAPKCYFEETHHEWEMKAKRAAERKRNNVPTLRGISTDELPMKRAKPVHQLLTVIHPTSVHKVLSISDEFDEYLLDLHQPDPMAPPHEEAWDLVGGDQVDTHQIHQ